VPFHPRLAGRVVDEITQSVPAGAHTRRNLARYGDVTLVWPPGELGGYT
jgi:hypothetical protein